MKELPTLQEVIERRAARKLDDDIRLFRNEIERVCNTHRAIAEAIKFPFTDSAISTITFLFHKDPVVKKVKEELFPCYVEREIEKMFETIDRVPKTPEE